MSILIVDPNVQELTQLKSGLESAGYEGVVSTESVREALGYYGVDSLGKLPSDVELILMDLTSPDAIESGFRTKPRQSWSTSRAVLVGLVNQNDSAGIKRAAEAGAHDVICRPVLKAELMMRVRSALALAAKMETAANSEASLEAELTKKACELEQVVSHNTEVLSLASHELKTPLANLSGYVDMILHDWERHGPPSDKQQQQLEAVQRNGFRMDALVNDIMAMAKIKSGTLELSPTDLDLAHELECVRMPSEPTGRETHGPEPGHSLDRDPDPRR
jgi:signal transduction histidine kinase